MVSEFAIYDGTNVVIYHSSKDEMRMEKCMPIRPLSGYYIIRLVLMAEQAEPC